MLAEVLAPNPRRRPLARKCTEHGFFGQLPAIDLDPETSRSRASPTPTCDDREETFPSLPGTADRSVSAEAPDVEKNADLDLDAELDAILGETRGTRGTFNFEPSPRESGDLVISGDEVDLTKAETDLPELDVTSEPLVVAATLQGSSVDDLLNNLCAEYGFDSDSDAEIAKQLRSVGGLGAERRPCDVPTAAQRPSSSLTQRLQCQSTSLGASMSAWEDSAQAEVRVPVLLSDSDAGEFEFPELEDAEKLQASHTGAESGLQSDKKASSEPDDEAQAISERLNSCVVRDRRRGSDGGRVADTRPSEAQLSVVASPCRQPLSAWDTAQRGMDSARRAPGLEAARFGDPCLVKGAQGSFPARVPDPRSRHASWSQEEAQQLRRIVKRVFRRGARDKDVLWTEVSNELASGRSPRECKAQYAREYRLHKAKEARQALGPANQKMSDISPASNRGNFQLRPSIPGPAAHRGCTPTR